MVFYALIVLPESCTQNFAETRQGASAVTAQMFCRKKANYLFVVFGKKESTFSAESECKIQVLNLITIARVALIAVLSSRLFLNAFRRSMMVPFGVLDERIFGKSCHTVFAVLFCGAVFLACSNEQAGKQVQKQTKPRSQAEVVERVKRLASTRIAHQKKLQLAKAEAAKRQKEDAEKAEERKEDARRKKEIEEKKKAFIDGYKSRKPLSKAKIAQLWPKIFKHETCTHGDMHLVDYKDYQHLLKLSYVPSDDMVDFLIPKLSSKKVTKVHVRSAGGGFATVGEVAFYLLQFRLYDDWLDFSLNPKIFEAIPYKGESRYRRDKLLDLLFSEDSQQKIVTYFRQLQKEKKKASEN